jgi:transcriptional regulator with XRE-family HTH domain
MSVMIGERIKQLRQKLALTQGELAGKINVKQAFISKIELGERSPSYETLKLIADVLGTTRTYLLEGIGDATVSQQNPENIGSRFEPFAAIVGYATELAEDSTHEERLRAARMLKSALAVLEDSETERFTERKSDGVAG